MATYSNLTTAESTAGTTSLLTQFNYLCFLGASLLVFLGYTILPKAVRAQYCGAGRRRYRRRRRRGKAPPPAKAATSPPDAVPPADILGHVYAYSQSFSPPGGEGPAGTPALAASGTPASSRHPSDATSSPSQSSARDSVWSGLGASPRSGRTPPHRALPQLLKDVLGAAPGVKFNAHGTKCVPRAVWITLHCDAPARPAPPDHRNCLTWRAELKASSAHAPPTGSPRPRMGNLRKVELHEILGIELGKRTTALRRRQTAQGVHERECFSLLTRAGTLDLACLGLEVPGGHASAEAVRAAFVACLARAMSAQGLRLSGAPAATFPSATTPLSTNAAAPSTPHEESASSASLTSATQTASSVSF